jgi:hypothetical protein
MTTRLATKVATRGNVNSVIADLKSLCGGLWLVMDRSTHCHWVIEVASIHTIRGTRYSREIANTGLVTISSPTGEPVFVIESNDSLTWLLPGETLLVQEGGLRGSAILLQRLDDINAPRISEESLERRLRLGEIIPTIRARDGRLIEIADCLLPTGDIEADAELKDIAATIEASVCLSDPHVSLGDVLAHLDRRLNALANRPELSSFIWLASLRETIERMQKSPAVA